MLVKQFKPRAVIDMHAKIKRNRMEQVRVYRVGGNVEFDQ